MKSQMSFALLSLGVLFYTTEVTSAPQVSPGQGGLIGVGNQLGTAFGNAFATLLGGFSNGAAAGFQTGGNTAQELVNGGLESYNAAAEGLVNGFNTFVGVPPPPPPPPPTA